MFKKLAQKLVEEREKHYSIATNPLEVDFENRKSIFLNKLTHSAVDLYERQCDIKNFSKLVLSNPENKSHDKMVEELFAQGVIDEDTKLLELSGNTRFLRDLGII